MNSNSFLSVLLLLAFWIISSFPNETAAIMAKPGCSDTCGNIQIPYPFGIGSNCAFNQSYAIACTSSSKPYLTQLNLEVLNISLWNQAVTVNIPINHSCTSRAGTVTSWGSSNLAGTPFFFSKSDNKMVFLGCGNAVLRGTGQENKVLTGCASTCEFNTSQVAISGCHGVSCCEAPIPFYLSRYQLDLTVSRHNTQTCSSAFLADQNWLPLGNLNSELSSPNVPVVLAWTLGHDDIHAMYPCSYSKSYYLDTDSGEHVNTNMCLTSACRGPRGWAESDNPYLQNGCPRIIDPVTKPRAALFGAIASIGFLLLIASIFTLFKLLKRKRERMIKEKHFKRNGGLLLQQQLSADEGVIEKTRIFTSNELDKASNGFNAAYILGQGGQGTVYKGMLTDGRIVAIKKSKKIDESQLDQFINEVVILSQVNHRNVVKLLGCCLETEVPLLVYEFIPNGTLFSLIHNQYDGDDDQFPFTWNLRFRIATEVAGALAYLHSATSMPIYHRDIKSSNILLDEKYIAKVSDFGTSRSLAIDKTHFTTKVQGTFGYLDPEYFQSSQFTEKSDVYSFGVVLVELLTRKKPILAPKTEEDTHLSLATQFLVSMDENRLNSVLDPQVLDEGNEDDVVSVAKLARRCLNLNGKMRPTMKEVAMVLENIKLSASHPTVEENFRSQVLVRGGECESLVFSDGNPSGTTENVSIRSESSAAYPLLLDTI